MGGEGSCGLLQLCLHSLCPTKEPCHICHDWCGCRWIVRPYLHETLVGGPTWAGGFCIALICPAHYMAEWLPNWHAAAEQLSPWSAGIGLHLWEWFTPSCIIRTYCIIFQGGVFNLLLMKPSDSLRRYFFVLNESCATYITVSCTANDEKCSKTNRINTLDRGEDINRNNCTLDWSSWRSHSQRLFKT